MAGRAPLSALALMALLAPGTAPAQEPPRLGPDGSWRVTHLDGAEIAPSDNVVLTFEAGRVTGRNGCNRINGSYSLMPGFSFGPLMATRMACAGRGAEIERAFNAAVEKVNDWRLDGDDGLELLLDARPLLRAVLAP